eukprot:4187913-Lingulodinium_polyedra.AAC.1
MTSSTSPRTRPTNQRAPTNSARGTDWHGPSNGPHAWLAAVMMAMVMVMTVMMVAAMMLLLLLLPT